MLNKLKKIKSYPNYRKWHSISYIVMLIAIVFAVVSVVISAMTGNSSNMLSLYLGYTAIALVIVFYLLNFMYWRCPKCNKTLPLLGPVPVCRVCKHKFMDEKGEFHW